MARKRLTKEQQVFLVRSFARFVDTREVREAFKAQFGFEIESAHASYYNPDSVAGAAIAKDLRAVFDADRKAYLDDITRIPTANLAVRLAIRDKMIRDLEGKGAVNRPLIDKLLESQAKDLGGKYTNRKEVTGKDGGPLEVDVATLTPEQRATRAAQIAAAAARRKAKDR